MQENLMPLKLKTGFEMSVFQKIKTNRGKSVFEMVLVNRVQLYLVSPSIINGLFPKSATTKCLAAPVERILAVPIKPLRMKAFLVINLLLWDKAESVPTSFPNDFYVLMPGLKI